MNAEFMRPHGETPPLMEGGTYKPPLFEPTSIPQTRFQEIQPQLPEYELQLQKDVSEKLIKLFGSDYTPAIARRALRERGRVLSDVVTRVPLEYLDSGQLDEDTLREIGSRTSCVRITAAAVASQYGINLKPHIEAVIMEKIWNKYNPDSVFELITYGTEENPGELTPAEAMSEMRGTWDPERRIQNYQRRGFWISPEEEAGREQTLRYSNEYQSMVDWWQIRAQGRHLRPSQRVSNLIGENGEVEEAVNVLKGLSIDEINSLSRGNAVDIQLLQLLGDELADVFVGTWCTDASLRIDSDEMDQERMKIAIDKFADSRKMKKAGVAFEPRMGFLDERYKRAQLGLKPPTPPMVWHSGRQKPDSSSDRPHSQVQPHQELVYKA